jgi:hypothetical protein
MHATCQPLRPAHAHVNRFPRHNRLLEWQGVRTTVGLVVGSLAVPAVKGAAAAASAKGAVALRYGGHCVTCRGDHWLPCTTEAVEHGALYMLCWCRWHWMRPLPTTVWQRTFATTGATNSVAQ